METKNVLIDTEYIRANITVDVYSKSNMGDFQLFYVHNWKGLIYTVCNSLSELIRCLEGDTSVGKRIATESELDDYLGF